MKPVESSVGGERQTKGEAMIGRRRLAVTAFATLVLTGLSALSACGSRYAVNAPKDVAGGGGKGGYGYHIAVVTHGAAGDAFWTVVKNGAQQAGKDMGDSIDYQNSGDPSTQAQQIDAAVNKKPAGLVVSMANPEALRAAVQRAVAAGIPVITINAGQAESAQYGALSHIGSDETVAGQAVGTQLKKAGVKHVICVIHEAGNVSLEQRCAGVKDTLGGTVTNLQVDVNNLPSAQSLMKAKLQSDKSVDGVVTLNGQVATSAEGAISGAGSAAKLVTFDLNADVAKAITGGKILFAVDQQPYLQGYLAVQMLTLYKSNLNILGGGQPVLTGPNLVTKQNAAQILQLAAKGTR